MPRAQPRHGVSATPPRSGVGGEDERLHRDVRIDVVIGQERFHAAAGHVADDGRQVVAHRLLKAQAHVLEERVLSGFEQLTLGLGEGVAHDAYHQFAVDDGADRRRPAAYVLGRGRLRR